MLYRSSCVALYESGKLAQLAERVHEIAASCTLCPHRCGVDRRNSRIGRCRSGISPVISSYSPHFGEEPPLVGRGGSGTIFFTNCNMRCIFCQNYEISQMGEGAEVSHEDLARMMLRLQELGCHNINFVTPTHMIPAIIKSLPLAIEKGLSLPLVYNSGGYDSAEILRLLAGVFDIYMPDLKYADDETGEALSGVKVYATNARRAVREMFDQGGDLWLEGHPEAGAGWKTGENLSRDPPIAVRGLLVRHLVLPENLAGSFRVMDFLADLSRNTFVNIMGQYRPLHRARSYPGLGRRATIREIDEVVKYARSLGMRRVIH
ncbi:MAG: radical SAM protein [Methanothrix sp.]|nr:radical SAM protein [Methanothrix sp.]